MEPETITSLEKAIKTLKTLPKTKENKLMLREKNTALRNLYATAKNAVLNYEKANRDHLLFVQSTENFYKLFEHSALFYSDGLADKIGKSARVMPDDDFCDRSSIGYCAIRDIEKVTIKLTNLGCASCRCCLHCSPTPS